MKKLTYLLLCLALGIGMVTAQTTKVTGTVISAEDSEPIIGASVIVKGTTTGTVTDFDGAFTLSVPSSAKTLIISYVGMIGREVPVQPTMKVVLQSGLQNLEEVVVTAIGMKKQEKSLGYAASTVKSDDLVAAKSGSVMSGLSGKVAGLNITSAGGTGTSQKVIVRGVSSFSNNQPLYVVDGVPIQNSFQGENSFANSVDFGNQANDVNPDDVESVTVLKGASATALYGSRAANGVIMITTKRAGAERLSVTYDGSFMGSSVLRVPQTQDKFGQGWGSFGPMENGSWGPVLDGREHMWGPYSDGSKGTLTPLKKPFSYVKDNLRHFYDTGFEMNNNVSIRMGNDKLGLVASFGNVKSNGVLPGDADTYARNTFSLRGNAKYKRFSAEINFNYVRKDIMQASAGQGNDGASMFSEILQHAVDVDMSSMKDYNNPYFNTDNFYTAYAQNPYWVLDNNRNKYQDDRVYGKIELAFDIMDGLKAVGRIGGDFTNSRQNRWNQKINFASGSWSEMGGKKEEPGTYTEQMDYIGQIDATAFLNANYKIGEDISLGGMIGWNMNQQTSSYMRSYLFGLEQPGWYSLSNGIDKPTANSYRDARRLIGLFAQAEFGYKNFWFVNLSARNDWSSTLPQGKNSFFYGGVNTSLILTDM
ncbi:MAG: SusC/RagA family TonB-linked outer membrane protein, partial [Tannerellaceae bacterium]